MMKNQLAGLMKQAQQMQDNMKKAQEELAQTEVEGQSGAGLVKVVMTCRHDVKRVTIDPSLLGEDKDMLEDLRRRRDQRRRAPGRGDDAGEDVGPHRRGCRCRPASSCRSDTRPTAARDPEDEPGRRRTVRRATRRRAGAAVRASTSWRARCAACRASARRPRSGWRCICSSTTATARVRLAHALEHAAATRPPLRALQHVHRGHDLRAVPVGASAIPSLLCVVETPADLLMVEQTQAYSGLYFVLMGRLSPLDGIGPKEIRLDRLLKRATDGVVREVILATNFTNEGEATAHYIGELLAARGLEVSRLARGVPVGGELEYVDSGTLAQALRERRRSARDAAPPARSPSRLAHRRPIAHAKTWTFPEQPV